MTNKKHYIAIDSLIYFPDELTDEEWCDKWGQLQYALMFDQQRGMVKK